MNVEQYFKEYVFLPWRYYSCSYSLSILKLKHFKGVDYMLWESICGLAKGDGTVEKAMVTLKYELFKDICQQRAYYKSRKLFIDLKLLIPSNVKGKYFLNPDFVLH